MPIQEAEVERSWVMRLPVASEFVLKRVLVRPIIFILVCHRRAGGIPISGYLELCQGRDCWLLHLCYLEAGQVLVALVGPWLGLLFLFGDGWCDLITVGLSGV